MYNKKTKYSALIIAVLLFGLAISSNPPNGRTGAPGDTFCTDCHGNPSSSIDGLIDISGVPSSIDPNTTYTITVTSEFTSGTPTRAGFQMVVLDGSDDDVGTLSNAGSSSTITPSGGRTYFEHSPSLNFGGNSTVTWDVEWTSPAGPDMEEITFYASTILANGNGNNSGDRMKLTNVSGFIDAPIANLELEVLEVQDISCFGANDGSALVEVTGGVPPYEYDWSNGEDTNPALSLGEGLNTLIVTDDSGATISTDVTIFEPDPITIDFEEIDASCFGFDDGMIFTTATGGTGDFDYEWSNGAETSDIFNLNSGTYLLTITDDNGCDAAFDFEIGQPDPIILTSSNVVDATCIDLGSISISLEGGTGNLFVDWDNGDSGTTISNLQAGVYSAFILDENMCAFEQEFFVDGPTDLNYVVLLSDIECNGFDNGSIELEFDSDSDYSSITWSTGETGTSIFDLSPGDYSVTIEDNFFCLYEEIISISEPSAIEITDVVITDALCDELGSIQITTTGGTGNLTAEWSNGVTGNLITDLTAGTYSVDVFDENNCILSASYTIDQSDNLEFTSNTSSILCNGDNNGSIELIFNDPNDYESILWSNGETTTSISNLVAGTYSVTITDIDLCEFIESFVISEPQVLALAVTPSNDILCFGDVINSLTVTATGGTSPYTITSMGVPVVGMPTLLSAGTYLYDVTDANGCISSVEFVTANPTQLEATATTNNASGPNNADGSVIIAMTGGVAPYSINGMTFNPDQLLTGILPGIYTNTVTDSNNCSIDVSFNIMDDSVDCDDLSVSFDLIQPECSGDEPIFNATVTGGTPPYTEVFTPQNFYNGDFPVSYIDAEGCSITEIVPINYIDIIPPTVNIVDATANIGATGAIEPFVYDNGSVDNCGGKVTFEFLTPFPDCNLGETESTIIVNVSDEIGNSTTGSFVLTLSDTIAPSIFCLDDMTINDCNSFVIPTPIVTDNCGTPTITIDGQQALELGINEITYIAEDAFGNTSSCTVTITVETEINYTIETTDPSCFGSNDGFYEVNPENPSTIIYENGLFENLDGGTYFFTVVDEQSGCMITDSIVLIEPEEIFVSNEIVFPLSQEGAADGALDITIEGGIIPYTYSWVDDIGNVISTEAAVSNLPEGIYTLTVVDGNGCIFISQAYTISFETSIKESYLQQVGVYPNPFTKDIFIDSPRSLDQINVFNAQGKLVISQEQPDNAINLEFLDPGIYLIELQENEENAFKRIIKQ